MKAAVYYGVGDVRIEERAIPVAGPNQMVVKIEYCGICGTDVEAYRHGIIKPPIVLGHENVGVVYQVGEGVQGYKVGDRVLCGPPSACSKGCASCKDGRTNICSTGFERTAGIGGPDGGFAEYLLIQDVAHTMILPVPDEVAFKDAVLFDIYCVALHAIRRSNFKSGDTVVVSGTGPIGLAAMLLLSMAGARKIIALGRTKEKEALAKQFGADAYISTEDCLDIRGEICNILQNEEGADIAFECAGNQKSLLNCIFHTTRNGRQVVLVGTIGEPMDQLVLAQVSPREIDLITSFVYTEEEIGMFLDMLKTSAEIFPAMVTGIISLDELVEKGLARTNKGHQMKILLAPGKQK